LKFKLKVIDIVVLIFEGGMMISGEDEKKKSPGGVFIAMIKKAPEVTQEQKSAMRRADVQMRKEKRRTLNLLGNLDIDKIKIP